MMSKDPNNQLEFIVEEIARLQRRLYNDCYREIGVNSTMVSSLIYLSREPQGIIQTELAEKLEIGKAATGTLIDKLEKEKFITRETSPHDRRVWVLKITDSGLQITKNAEEITLEIRKVFRKNTTKAERSSVVKVMSKMRNSLKDWESSTSKKTESNKARMFSRNN